MVSRGRLFDVLDHEGFVAELDGEWLGYATFYVAGYELEVTVLESTSTGRGTGSALLAACVAAALERGLGSYFEFYCYQRMHMALGYRTPWEVYSARRRPRAK